MLIDSHAHLDSERYAEDRAAMLRARGRRAWARCWRSASASRPAGWMGRSRSAASSTGSRRAGRIPRLYASAGVYPHNTHEIDDAVLAKLDSLLAEPEVIACGEIGLDYYHEGAPHEVQREGLIRQLEIAAARKRPILIHCRPNRRAHRRLGRSFSGSGRALAADRPGRRHALLWRRAGSRRGGRSTWVSDLVCRQPDLSQGPAAARCGRAGCRWTGFWSRPTPLAGAGARSRQAQRAGLGEPNGPDSGRFAGVRRKKSPPRPRKTSSGCFDLG